MIAFMAFPIDPFEGFAAGMSAPFIFSAREFRDLCCLIARDALPLAIRKSDRLKKSEKIIVVV